MGEVAKITCTPDYAYGAGGFPAWGIMPNSTLMFEIEVLSVCLSGNGLAWSCYSCLCTSTTYTEYPEYFSNDNWA